MIKPPSIWSALEIAGDASLPRARWAQLLGPDAWALDVLFVSAEDDLPACVSCPICERTLHLSDGPSGKLVGVPDSDCHKCEDYQLFDPEEVAHWRICYDTLMGRLSDALQLTRSTSVPYSSPQPIAFAAVIRPGGRMPVYFTCRPDGNRGYAPSADQLLRMVGGPFVLITPTYCLETDAILRSSPNIYLAAEDRFRHNGIGEFTADRSTIELLHPPTISVLTTAANNSLVSISSGATIEDDYRIIRFPDGRVVDFTDHPIAQAFTKYMHQRKLKHGQDTFLYDTAKVEFSKAHPETAITGARLKHELFKHQKIECDWLFEKISGRAQRFRTLL